MVLNEMRSMKEPKYSQLREVVRDNTRFGDRVFAALAEHAESIGVSKNSYNMIYEGFWDLYCRKPASADLSAKKLEGFANLVNLKLEGGAQPAEGEEEPAAAMPACKAVVRVRVPFKRPEPEEGEGEEGEAATDADAKSKQASEAPKGDVVLEEIEYEDKVLAVNTQGASYAVCVVHQLAQRFAREHIARCFKEFLPELQVLEEAEMLKTIEKEAEAFESEFLKIAYPELPVFDFELN